MKSKLFYFLAFEKLSLCVILQDTEVLLKLEIISLEAHLTLQIEVSLAVFTNTVYLYTLTFLLLPLTSFHSEKTEWEVIKT